MKFALVVSLLAGIFAGCGGKAEKEKAAEKEKPRLKGTGYGDGPIATPLRAKYSTERKVKVQWAVNDVLRLYKVEIGHAPKNQQEFEKMLKKYDVTLPKPQAGFYYHWNPKTEKVEFLPVEK